MSKQKNVPEYFKISSHFPSQKFFSPKNLILKISTFFANNIISIEAAKRYYQSTIFYSQLFPFFQNICQIYKKKKNLFEEMLAWVMQTLVRIQCPENVGNAKCFFWDAC